jgi:hypothetical protein
MMASGPLLIVEDHLPGEWRFALGWRGLDRPVPWAAAATLGIAASAAVATVAGTNAGALEIDLELGVALADRLWSALEELRTPTGYRDAASTPSLDGI